METAHSRPTCTFIPFQERSNILRGPMSQNSRDFVDGFDRRMITHRRVWSTCFLRMQEVLREIQKPIVSNVVDAIRNAHKNVLPGLPHLEIPFITVSGHNIVQNITQQLISSRDENDGQTPRRGRTVSRTTVGPACVAHVYPSGCTTLTLAMQTIATELSKFGARAHQAQGKVGARLTTYDINNITCWYNAMAHGTTSPPTIVILFHDFEQCNIGVIQDLLHIFSRHLHKLPVVLLAASSSTSIGTYLSTAYTRSTLSLVRFQHFSGASGIEVVEELITKTFFDPTFSPDIMIGPAMIQYIEERASTTDNSIDGIFTALQLAHLKHFNSPLALLAQDELLGTRSMKEALSLLSLPSSFQFLDSLLMRILAGWRANASSMTDELPSLTIEGLLAFVAEARRQFRVKLLGVKYSYSCLRLLQKWFSDNGYKATATATSGSQVPSSLETMRDVLSGRVNKDLKHFIMSISKLRLEKLMALLLQLDTFFEGIDRGEEDDNDSTSRKIMNLKQQLISYVEAARLANEEIDTAHPRDPRVVEAAQSLSQILSEFFDARVQPLDAESTTLWDVWYMGSAPFPTNFLDPAPRASVVGALLYPHLYIPPDATKNPDEAEVTSKGGKRTQLWQLPDTSILFWRYLEGGRMLNVYDWYESFKQVVDVQRGNSAAEELSTERGADKTAKSADADEDDEERDGLETQARFMRALHELDFLGFVKHTGRKADHIVRTAFDQE